MVLRRIAASCSKATLHLIFSFPPADAPRLFDYLSLAQPILCVSVSVFDAPRAHLSVCVTDGVFAYVRTFEAHADTAHPPSYLPRVDNLFFVILSSTACRAP